MSSIDFHYKFIKYYDLQAWQSGNQVLLFFTNNVSHTIKYQNLLKILGTTGEGNLSIHTYIYPFHGSINVIIQYNVEKVKIHKFTL
jgi:hypothetical protein